MSLRGRQTAAPYKQIFSPMKKMTLYGLIILTLTEEFVAHLSYKILCRIYQNVNILWAEIALFCFVSRILLSYSICLEQNLPHGRCLICPIMIISRIKASEDCGKTSFRFPRDSLFILNVFAYKHRLQ